ncbi:MAG: hypothetical protein GF398_15900 [Chitinivibrionales bacterium]|nr:hypothetical protein [Chitinivibrionales bacterium]
MKKRNVIDKRSIKLEHIMQDDYIPYMSGRPARVKIINKDDLTNLSIALNTSTSVEEFMAAL